MGVEQQEACGQDCAAPEGRGQGAPSGPRAVHAPWMSQQPKKGGGRKDKRAARAKKQMKKEQQWKQQLQQQHPPPPKDAEGLVVDPRSPPPPPSPRPGVTPIKPFVPSAAREVSLKRPLFLRRRGAVVSDMVQQLRRLQCPFVWVPDSLTPTLAGLYLRLDSTPHRPTPWHVAVEQIHLAFEFARQRVLWKSRELLDDVYAMLQEADKDVDEDSLLQRYRAGLKHVLDACWLFVREDGDVKAGRGLPDGSHPASIVPYEELGDKQRASVLAIKAMMEQGDTKAAKRAVELDPDEGQWRYIQGQSMRLARTRRRGHARDRAPDVTPEERALFEQAYVRRKNPQTVMRLARCYAGDPGLPGLPRDDQKRSYELIREALELYPLSGYVHLHSARLLDCLGRGERGARQVVICFKRAVQLGRGCWLRAHLEYGQYCLDNGLGREGAYHFFKACDFFMGSEDWFSAGSCV